MPRNLSLGKDLNPQQRDAVEYAGGPLLIAAGAGSGKTKTLTSRLAHLINNGAKPENIIAITFTNKAAKEMLDRISNFQFSILNFKLPFVGTFHSLGARILKKEARIVERAPNYTIYDDNDSLALIKKVMKEMELSGDKYAPISVQSKISQVKNELLDAGEFDKITAETFEKYERALIKNNAFDFDDLIEKVVRIFQKNPRTLEKYQAQFQYILVDEYQDINTAQYQFIKLLAQKHRNLSVVGDDQQAIYSFRGADFRNFLNFEEDWPNAKVVKLEQNYRSTGAIITAASELIKNNKFQKPKTLWTENEPGNQIKVVRAADPEEEASFIASQIENCSAGWRMKIENCAVLYRTNAQSRAIEQALIAVNIPYKLFGGVKFYERKEIKDLLAGLRLAANPKDAVSAERIIKNFDKKTAEYLLKELPRLSQKLGVIELINYFIINADYFNYLEKNHKNHRERAENINELIHFAGEFKTLDEFLERVALLQSTDAPAKTLAASGYTLNPVHLMTIHLAKGLEFDYVFVTGCSEGLLPHQRSYGSLDELEEERRLMYVAMTRAKKELCLSFANTPSRFIYEIPPELTEFLDLSGGVNELPGEEENWII